MWTDILVIAQKNGHISPPDPLAKLFNAHVAGKDFAFAPVGNAAAEARATPEQQQEYKAQEEAHKAEMEKQNRKARVLPFTQFSQADMAKRELEMKQHEDAKDYSHLIRPK